MRERTAGFIESLLLALARALLPARGRHRAPAHQRPCQDLLLAAHPATPFEWDTHLVRPYLLTPEERRERRLRHGVEVAA